MASKRRLHFKDLDSLRFLAFVPVFLYCALYLIASEDNPFITDISGVMGFVKQNSFDFFFFLSSFLLTSHAMREYKYKKRFGIKWFYIRRLIKLLPLMILGILFAFLIHPAIVNILGFEPISSPKITSYFFKYPTAIPSITKEQFIPLAVIWTIYMFLQFYVFWGFILKFFIQQINYVGIGLIAIGIAARIFHVLTDTSYEFNVLAAGIPIGAGAMVANVVRNDERTVELIKHLSKGTHLLVYLIGIATIVLGYTFLGNTYADPVVAIISSAFFAYVVVEQTYSKESIFKFRKSKILSRLGKISYGLLIYQSFILVIGVISIDSLNLDMGTIAVQIMFIALGFALTWITADVSYNFLERPIYTIRKEFKNS